MPYLLGIDVGTSSTKSELFDLEGNSIAVAQEEYPIISPNVGYAEEDPENGWWKALQNTVKIVLKTSKVNPKEILGVCVSGTNACVAVDREGKAIINAIMQLDNRSIKYADKIRETVGEEKVFQITGNRIASGTFLAPTILWIKENMPKVFEKTYKFMVPTGFITMKLTGKYTIDLSRCSTTLLYRIGREKGWSQELCKILDIPLEKLPEAYISKEVVGEVCDEASKLTGLARGTQVVAGCMDTVGAAVGSAIVEEGEAFYTLGTLGRFCCCMSEPKFDKRFINICHAIEDRWLAMALMQGGGLSMRWFRDELATVAIERAKILGKSAYQIIDEEAEKVPAGSRGIIFLPYLSGEKSPIWDPYARGVLFGFTAMHKMGEVARAVMEGVAYSLRHNIEVFEEAGFSIPKVRVGGGGVKSRLWRKIIADVTGKTVEVTKMLATETFGDALIAGLGTGVYRSLGEIKKMVKVDEEILPDAVNHKRYTGMFELYKRIYDHLREDFAELSKMEVS
ncbi:MAG: FGGY-family carbohydrate kinase [Nitrososphaeria archaeon]|nr:FGGY-family carbohydrate kinase [Nitrososphaeria archaeon]